MSLMANTVETPLSASACPPLLHVSLVCSITSKPGSFKDSRRWRLITNAGLTEKGWKLNWNPHVWVNNKEGHLVAQPVLNHLSSTPLWTRVNYGNRTFIPIISGFWEVIISKTGNCLLELSRYSKLVVNGFLALPVSFQDTHREELP